MSAFLPTTQKRSENIVRWPLLERQLPSLAHHQRWIDARWEIVHWSEGSHISNIVSGNSRTCALWAIKLKGKTAIQVVTSTKLRSQHLWWCGAVLFLQDIAMPHSVHLTMVWLHSKRVQTRLDRPACIPNLSPIENVWLILKHIIQQDLGLLDNESHTISSKNRTDFYIH